MDNRLLWTPHKEGDSNLEHFKAWLNVKFNLHLSDYQSIHEWSVRNYPTFWASLLDYFSIQYDGSFDAVCTDVPMPKVRWFEGTKVSYSEHIYTQNTRYDSPVYSITETNQDPKIITSKSLWEHVSKMRQHMATNGIVAGDRVVAYLPNVPEALIGFLAANSLGAVWSSCSPDFGTQSVIERFEQIKPKMLIACNGYTYNGKVIDKRPQVAEIIDRLTHLENVVILEYIENLPLESKNIVTWHSIQEKYAAKPLNFVRVPFNDPIWVLYSSGTTGIPKAIVHGMGGILLEHLKYLTFQNDVKPGQKFFWYSTTGWMMWNFLVGSMLTGASPVLYEGSPTYPNISALWSLSEKIGIHHFGTSAPFIMACQKQGLDVKSQFELDALISIGSTGSPLPPEGFDYIYEKIKTDVWLTSMSGGTDVCTAFVGGCPTKPVFQGEIQCAALGVSLESWDENGHPLHDVIGEMVITKPMPSMPIYFWNDANFEKYESSYFEDWPGIWRHGDWIRITPNYGMVIYGRSDATLNRHGIRIGTSEIYRAVDTIDAVQDSLIVNLELDNGNTHYMPLFVVLKPNYSLTDELKATINLCLKSTYSPRHVPDEIIQVSDIPYTISGKKLEAPIKKILLGKPLEKSVNLGSVRNPQSLDFFISFQQKIANL
jgi:acetoacetyl-CoA synthetase